MSLEKLLSGKKTVVLEKWFDAIIESYPADTSAFLKTQKNPFSNPVGQAILDGIDNLFDELLKGDIQSDRVNTFLDNIIRIRAVQDFTPSQAVAFIFDLKKVIREELSKEIKESNCFDELYLFESNIDSLAMISFDVFMKCREKLYDIKANELKKMTFRLLQKANVLVETGEQKPELISINHDNAKQKEVAQ